MDRDTCMYPSRGLYSIPALPGSICIESKQCEADDDTCISDQ